MSGARTHSYAKNLAPQQPSSRHLRQGAGAAWRSSRRCKGRPDNGVRPADSTPLPPLLGSSANQARTEETETMTQRRFWVYFLLFLFNVICYLDRINMSVAGRSVAQEFGISPVALGYLFSSFLWAYVVMMLPSGRLVDSLGPHRMAAIGATVWSIAQMLSGAATGFVTMLLTRLGLGAGEAPTFPVSYRSVRDWAPYTERGLAVGLIQAGTLLGPALSAPLVAWLIDLTSWRTSFVVTGAIGLVWVVVWLAFVSTPEHTRWLPEFERRLILAERHGGDVPAMHDGVGYRGLLRSPSMWGLAISQGSAVYSVYLYFSC